VKTKTEKEHYTFVHNDYYNSACIHQRYTVLTSKTQKEAKIK